MKDRIINFSAGPAVLPEEVLKTAQAELLNFNGTGMSIMEMSHRSKPFEDVLAQAEQNFRDLYGIPEDYAVLFLQGGASLQFSMVPMNLYQQGKPVDVFNTGIWSQKAIQELAKVGEYHIVASSEETNFDRIPSVGSDIVSPNASYAYICSNNTIFGTQWKQFPKTGKVPLVADMSSDIMSKKINVRDFGLIFAGAQKNLGPSGVTIVIIRKDLAEKADKKLPVMLQYKTHIENTSLYNTPPTFGIYIVGLVLKWIKGQGGLAAIEKQNRLKAARLYDAIDGNPFYYCPVSEDSRSDMNVVFRITGNDEALEKQFVTESEKAGLSGLKGHRSVGGLRASIYNAMPEKGIDQLVDFMATFSKKHAPAATNAR